jgi:hypothetical protein
VKAGSPIPLLPLLLLVHRTFHAEPGGINEPSLYNIYLNTSDLSIAK